MSRHIHIYAFDMNCVGHINHGIWRHPRDTSSRYNTMEYWADLARTAERGKLDGIFLADIIGVYDVYKGDPSTAIASGAQTPVNDPLLIVPIMAYVTKHLGFGVTVNTTYEPPYLLARRLSTLDHLTNGRIGWNIVTGYLDSAARGMGLSAQPDHDARYDVADEYMDVLYRLWEESWEDGAVRVDRMAGVYADPSKVRPIRHEGQHYRLDAIHLSEPSPQRTPVLYQAGSSTRGRQFAARHAECAFIGASSPEAAASIVADIRAKAVAAGRAARSVKLFSGLSVVVGRTEKEAYDKFEDYRRYADIEGALAHYSSSIGIDLSRLDPDEPITYRKTNANNSALEAITTRSADSAWTVRRIIDQMVLGSRQKPVVGTPEQIVEVMRRWVEIGDIDGFNLPRTVAPESLRDFVDLVVPVLQEQGLFKHDYARGSLREKLFETDSPHIDAAHPAARFRRPA
ncbi:LLM class flavin-dependent oxidoreductase (plasmid) [Shinella sumterensis]|nr:LLM class flavin-dependent oxidoreductase [Shinella sumterensis]